VKVEEASTHLAALAERHFTGLSENLPKDGNGRFALFLEITRTMDYWAVAQQRNPLGKRLSPHDFSLAQWGWSVAARHLLQGLQGPGLPVARADIASLKTAGGLLREFGIVFLLRRFAEMARCGFVTVSRTVETLVIDNADFVTAHFADDYEKNRWLDLEEKLTLGPHDLRADWELFDGWQQDEIAAKVGSFYATGRMPWLGDWKLSDPDSEMRPLVRPWTPGKGAEMMAYDSTPRINFHFMAEAVPLVLAWKSETGISLAKDFGSATTSDLVVVTTLLASMCLKHVGFAEIAAKHFPAISIPHSLTVWTPAEPFLESIARFTGLEICRVRQAVAALTLRASEAEGLPATATFYPPLIIDLQNGYFLRPASGITHNPFHTAASMLAWRDPESWSRFMDTREELMRDEFYALFQGVRYARVDGNVKVRNGARIATDIDAAILDRTTGELLLVQLKWQDHLTNDFRKFRSKARNLVEGLNKWTDDVLAWLGRESLQGVAKSLRFNSQRDGEVRRVYLLALSRTIARPDGFGYSGFREELAVAHWYHFLRTRFEIGPAGSVFGAIHQRLKSDSATTPTLQALPFEFTAQGQKVRVERFWCAYEPGSAESR
jgi:hypothetical protein